MRTLICLLLGPVLAVAAGEISMEQIDLLSGNVNQTKAVNLAYQPATPWSPAVAEKAAQDASCSSAAASCAGRSRAAFRRGCSGRGFLGIRGRIQARQSMRAGWRSSRQAAFACSSGCR